jgi:hypothetical protein
MLLTGTFFLRFSSAVSAGVLSPSEALAYSHHDRLSQLSSYLSAGQGFQNRLRGASQNRVGDRIQDDRGSEGEVLSTSLLGSRGLSTRESRSENGTAAESDEAADLMLPSDPIALANLPESKIRSFNKSRVDRNHSRVDVPGSLSGFVPRLRESRDPSEQTLPEGPTATAHVKVSVQATYKSVNESTTRATNKTELQSLQLSNANASIQAIHMSINEPTSRAANETELQSLQPADSDELFEAFLSAKALAAELNPDRRSNPKVAFLFLTRGPLYHELLWQKFFQGHDDRYSIYVHASLDGFVYNETTSKAPVFFDRQIKSIKVSPQTKWNLSVAAD